MKKLAAHLMVMVLLLSLAACGQAMPTWQEQYDLGLRYLSEGNYEEAILAFTAAIEIDPMRPDAYISLAKLYIEQGNTEAAIAVLEQGWQATGDTALEELLLAQKWAVGQLPDDAKQVFDWYYTTMQAEDYKSIARLKATGCDFNPVPIDFFQNNPDYIGLCYDGTVCITDLDGTGLKVINEDFVYYGELIAGMPTGQGACVDIRSREANDAALALEIYIGSWIDGLPNGEGSLHWAVNNENKQDIDTYKGMWSDGLADGEFVRILDWDSVGVVAELSLAFSEGKVVYDSRFIKRADKDGAYRHKVELRPEDGGSLTLGYGDSFVLSFCP